jgi:ribosome-associated heat shock protein Hsp15
MSSETSISEVGGPEAVRVDKWLWAARLFKTRSQASKACAAGHVKLNGESVKASKSVRCGDHLEVQTKARGLRILDVLRLSDKRGPASVARTLYDDHTPPPPPKEERDFARRERGSGRPAKRDRRLLNRLRGR